jgi:hypothetical protein
MVLSYFFSHSNGSWMLALDSGAVFREFEALFSTDQLFPKKQD